MSKFSLYIREMFVALLWISLIGVTWAKDGQRAAFITGLWSLGFIAVVYLILILVRRWKKKTTN